MISSHALSVTLPEWPKFSLHSDVPYRTESPPQPQQKTVVPSLQDR